MRLASLWTLFFEKRKFVFQLNIFFFFRRGYATLRLAVSVGPFVRNILKKRAVFAFLPLPNRPRLSFSLSGLVSAHASKIFVITSLRSFSFSRWPRWYLVITTELILITTELFSKSIHQKRGVIPSHSRVLSIKTHVRGLVCFSECVCVCVCVWSVELG